MDDIIDKVDKDSSYTANLAVTLPYYKYTKEAIDKFFACDNGQQEEHTLEENICRPLIGIRDYKPFFRYCKMNPRLENMNLISIENHVRLLDPQYRCNILQIVIN